MCGIQNNRRKQKIENRRSLRFPYLKGYMKGTNLEYTDSLLRKVYVLFLMREKWVYLKLIPYSLVEWKAAYIELQKYFMDKHCNYFFVFNLL